MDERISNYKIQPYCIDCLKIELFQERLTNYLVNEEQYEKKHKSIIRASFYENVIKIPFLIALGFTLIPTIFGYLFLEGTPYELFVFLIPLLGFIVAFIKAFSGFEEPTSIYSKPNIENIEEQVQLERKRNKEEVNRFIKSVHKEFEFRSIGIDKIDRMDGYEFEKFVAELLKKIGYTNVKVTKKSGDGGVDILATNLLGESTAIQCKRLKSKVGNSAIQEIFLGKKLNKCKRGMVITNSYFTKPAFQAAFNAGIELWSRKRLIEELKKQAPLITWEEFLSSYYIKPKGRPGYDKRVLVK